MPDIRVLLLALLVALPHCGSAQQAKLGSADLTVFGPLRPMLKEPCSAFIYYWTHGDHAYVRVGMRFLPKNLGRDRELIAKSIKDAGGWIKVATPKWRDPRHPIHIFKRKGPWGPEQVLYIVPTDNNQLGADYRRPLSPLETKKFFARNGRRYTEKDPLEIKVR